MSHSRSVFYTPIFVKFSVTFLITLMDENNFSFYGKDVIRSDFPSLCS